MSGPAEPDLSACAREPIHIPGAIQPHGCLLLCRAADLVVLQASENAAALLPGATPGAALADFLPDAATALRGWMRLGAPPVLVLNGAAGGFDLAAHLVAGDVLLEAEPVAQVADENLFVRLVAEASNMPPGSVEAVCQATAELIRRLAGFDRVLAYRFDAEWNGTVIAESRNERLPSYLDLRFPAGDIPPQARALYSLETVRLIADAQASPVPILPAWHPVTGAALDLSRAALRAAAPVHVEYMRNMGTRASMSVAVMVGGRLWGLLAGHAATKLVVPRPVRTACAFAAQALALRIAAVEGTAEAAERLARQALHNRLLIFLAQQDHGGGPRDLLRQPSELLGLVGADGAALVQGGECHSVGLVPPEPWLLRLAAWLPAPPVVSPDLPAEMPMATDSLAEQHPEAAKFADIASGMLGLRLQDRGASCLLWFRPELLRTITWGGDPSKIVVASDAGNRLQPRASFTSWSDTVRRRSRPWSGVDIDAARDLGRALTGIILRRAEALAGLSEELTRSNRELEAFSYSVSHDLRAPFRHVVGFAQLLRERLAGQLDETSDRYLTTITEAGLAAGRLVDDLLAFSRLGRAGLAPGRVDVAHLVAEARLGFELDLAGRRIEWRVGDLPIAWGDAAMLRQVVQNLLSNAVKYSRGRDPAIIEVGAGPGAGGETVYWVRDNGIGFDMAYVGKLFGVFQRLHRAEDYEGNGIGLALVHRIVERHGGRLWAEAAPDRGATFFFALPTQPAATVNPPTSGG